MTQKLSVEEIKAVAEAAIGARQKATDAKAAADAAGGSDTDLNTAHTEAERAATDAETKALALSPDTSDSPDDKEKKKQKLLRKRGFIDKDLRDLGVDVNEEDDEDEEEDLDKPLTRRDLQTIEANNARQTSVQMVEELADPLDRTAVREALKLVVPTGNPHKDFQAAVAIANIDRNSKILEEIGRRPVTRTTPTGNGAPPLRVETFVPTKYEQILIDRKFLTKDEVLKARAKAKV